jgi:hypothetical protein
MNLVCLLIAWGLSISTSTTIVIYCVRGFQHIRRLHRIPCSKCQYFTDSCFLKCTVHPNLACSEAAIDCRDFVLQSKNTHQKLVNTQAFVHHI